MSGKITVRITVLVFITVFSILYLKHNSFFYHPSLEFDDIKVTRDSDVIHFITYNNTSILHQIINLFHEKGYTFKTVNDMK